MIENISVGSIISHYRIIDKIGAGGMGEGYLAQDTRLHRKVAIKFLNPEFSKHAHKLNRFIQEAKTTSPLNHPNVLPAYSIAATNDTKHSVPDIIADWP